MSKVSDLRDDFDLLLSALQSIAVTSGAPEIPLGLTGVNARPILFQSNDVLHFRLNEAGKRGLLQIYSSDGSVLLRKELLTNEGEVDFPINTKGIFFYLMEFEQSNNYRGKLLVNNLTVTL